MRILIYTGKGGVGKTSISAATACALAHAGKRVLIMSTDQAHSLGDSFGIKLSHQAMEIFPNLDAMEIDSIEESKEAWGNLRNYLKQILSEKANGGIEAEEILLFPGLDEVFSLLRILEVYEQGKYDIIVVDCAPTGEALSLFTYSEKLSVLADKILPMVRNMNSVLGSFISKKTTVPKPKDVVFEEFISLVKRLNRLQELLHRRDLTSMRIVMTPERIVLDEARRNYTWNQLYDFGVDVVYMNKIYPKQALDGYFSQWESLQEKNIQIAQESFPNQMFFKLELQNEELRGKEKLDQVSKLLYEHIDPSAVFCKEPAFRIEESHGTRIFIIHLPFADKKEIFVQQEGSDLILSLRNEIRRFHLPDNLSRRTMSKYLYENEELRIYMDY